MSEGTDAEVVEQPTIDPAVEATAAAAAFDAGRGVETTELKPVEPVAETPKLFAGKTEAELTALLNEIPSMKEGFRKQIDNLAGNHGALKSAFQRLQQDTPKGQPVKVTDEDFAEMQAEFPELAGMYKKSLESVLSRGNASSGTFDPALIDERVNKLVMQKVSDERVAIHRDILSGNTPDWETVIGIPDEAKFEQLIRQGKSESEALAEATPKTEYRSWLATQPKEYQQQIASSNNAFQVNASIQEFRKSQEQIVKKQEQSKQRLANVIQPQGSVAARPTVSEQQAADEAFRRGRSG